MVSRNSRFAVLTAFVLAAVSAAAQSPSDPPRFRAAVDLVALSVTVTDKQQEFVRGLTRDDFVVYENGVPQAITYFRAENVPLDLAVVVDTSASMAEKIGLVRESVGDLVGTLREGDRASLVAFQQRVSVRQQMTSDLAAVGGALRGMTMQGNTALFDAMYVTLTELGRQGGALGASREVRRRAIVVLSDGEDTTSYITPDRVQEVARRAGATVYVVALRPDTSTTEKYSPRDYALKKIAEESGGQAFFPREIDEVESIYAGIGAELSSQYALGYIPREAPGNGEWRQVQVRVVGGRNLTPRTRAGYYASDRS